MKKYIFAACAFALLFGFYKAEASDLLRDIESVQPATLSLSQSALDEVGATLVKASLPKAGDSFKGGDTVKVKWNPSQLRTEEVAVLISYFENKDDDMPIISDYMTYAVDNNGSYEYELPDEMPDGYYRIYVASSDENIRVLAESGVFKITSGAKVDSAILKSLENAQAKGSNAAAKAHLSNARAQAELYFDDNNNSYKGVCKKGNDGIAESVASAGLAVKAKTDCDSNEKQWAAETKLLLKEGYFCVDSTGSATAQKKSKGKSATSCVKGKTSTSNSSSTGLLIQKLVGVKKSYGSNEIMEFSTKVLYGKNKVAPSDDISVLSKMTDKNSVVQSYSVGTYDAKTKKWNFKQNMPPESGTYTLEVYTGCFNYEKDYCSVDSLAHDRIKTAQIKVTGSKSYSNSSLIRITSPNGGEVIRNTGSVNFAWTMPTGKAYGTTLFLMPSSDTEFRQSEANSEVRGHDIGGGASKDINYQPVENTQWSIGGIRDGRYKARVYLFTYEQWDKDRLDITKALGMDESDDYFTIDTKSSNSY